MSLWTRTGDPTSPAAATEKEPDYRFTLANERTFLAYLRTALGLDAAGLAASQLLRPTPEHLRAGIAVLLTVLGAIVAVLSYRRWLTVQKAMRLDEPIPPVRLPLLLSTGITVASVAAVVYRRHRPVRPSGTSPGGVYDPAGQLERTSLAWGRTGVAIVANGALLMRAGLEHSIFTIDAFGFLVILVGVGLWGLSGLRYLDLAGQRAEQLLTTRPWTVLAQAGFVALLSGVTLVTVLAR